MVNQGLKKKIGTFLLFLILGLLSLWALCAYISIGFSFIKNGEKTTAYVYKIELDTGNSVDDLDKKTIYVEFETRDGEEIHATIHAGWIWTVGWFWHEGDTVRIMYLQDKPGYVIGYNPIKAVIQLIIQLFMTVVLFVGAWRELFSKSDE